MSQTAPQDYLQQALLAGDARRAARRSTQLREGLTIQAEVGRVNDYPQANPSAVLWSPGAIPLREEHWAPSLSPWNGLGIMQCRCSEVAISAPAEVAKAEPGSLHASVTFTGTTLADDCACEVGVVAEYFDENGLKIVSLEYEPTGSGEVNVDAVILDFQPPLIGNQHPFKASAWGDDPFTTHGRSEYGPLDFRGWETVPGGGSISITAWVACYDARGRRACRVIKSVTIRIK